MGLLNRKSVWHRIINSRLTIVILLIASTALSFAVYDRYIVEQDMRDRRNDTEEDLSKLRARQIELEDKVEYLSNEQGLEAEIRRHFDVSKEGEQVIVIMGDSATVTPNVLIKDRVEVEEEGFWRSLLPW